MTKNEIRNIIKLSWRNIEKNQEAINEYRPLFFKARRILGVKGLEAVIAEQSLKTACKQRVLTSIAGSEFHALRIKKDGSVALDETYGTSLIGLQGKKEGNAHLHNIYFQKVGNHVNIRHGVMRTAMQRLELQIAIRYLVEEGHIKEGDTIAMRGLLTNFWHIESDMVARHYRHVQDLNKELKDLKITIIYRNEGLNGMNRWEKLFGTRRANFAQFNKLAWEQTRALTQDNALQEEIDKHLDPNHVWSSRVQELLHEAYIDQCLGIHTSFHCKSGIDRTGMAFALQSALRKISEGKKQSQIFAIINNYEELSRQMLEKNDDDLTQQERLVKELREEATKELFGLCYEITKWSTELPGLKYHDRTFSSNYHLDHLLSKECLEKHRYAPGCHCWRRTKAVAKKLCGLSQFRGA